jgi:hypothetical protein
MRPAISFCLLVSFFDKSPNHAWASRTDRAVASPMSESAIFTARASGLRRLPPQASQGVSPMKRPISSRDQSLSVSL